METKNAVATQKNKDATSNKGTSVNENASMPASKNLEGQTEGQTPLLQLKDVCKTYYTKGNRRNCTAITGVNATFEKGERVAILGSSGSGKTTLLQTIAGTTKPECGDVLFAGKALSTFSDARRCAYRAHNVSVIEAHAKLIEHANVFNNVFFACAFNKTSPDKARKQAKAALELVGMQAHANEFPEHLTRAQTQLVAIARAVVKNPVVVLADDITATLDGVSAKEVLSALKKATKDKLLIFATQNENFASECASTIYKMADGKLECSSNANETQSPASALGSASNAKEQKAAKAPRVPLASSMRFAFVRKLSFSNFKKHKFRTLFAVLSASIGVIAIAFVLAVSNGLTNYVNYAQETSLSSSPITISKYKTQSSSNTTQAKEGTSSDDNASTTSDSETATKRSQYLNDAINNRRIALNNTLASLMSKNAEQKSEESAQLLNDVASLKAYLNENPDGVLDSCASVEYTYNTTPVIYSTANNTCKEVYPGSMFGSVGTGSSGTQGSRTSVTSASTLSSMFSDFRPLPENPSTYEDSASLVEGKWPENSSECVLVINSDGTMDDTLAYTLGFKDFKAELQPLLEKYNNGEKVDWPGIYDSYAYADVLGIAFKTISPAEVYQKQADGTWSDMSSEENYLQNVVNAGRDLKIVGVVKPTSDSKANAILSEGIYYHSTLDKENIERSQTAQIVQEQIANPNVDVTTGKTFDYLKNASTILERFDFSNIVNVDTDAMAAAVTVHPEVFDFLDADFAEEEKEEIKTAVEEEVTLTDEQKEQLVLELLNDPDFQTFLKDMAKSPNFDASVEEVLAGAGAAYAEYCAWALLNDETPQEPNVYFAENGAGYEWTVYAQLLLPESLSEDVSKFVAKYATQVSNYIVATVESEVNNLIVDIQNQVEAELQNVDAWFNAEDNADAGPALIEFDEDKFFNAIQINITQDDIDQMGYYIAGATSHTYAGNLSDFGYADINKPATCTIYPNSFADKEKITQALEKYNTSMRNAGDENKVIAYSDTIGSFVKIALSAIEIISSIIIAFVCVSAISVVIMISVICGISTLQRAREVGILRALGASKRDVFKVFNTENALMGFLAGAFGFAVVGGLCYAINKALRGAGVNFDVAQLTPEMVVAGIAIATVVTSLAGILPAFFASRKRVHDQ